MTWRPLEWAVAAVLALAIAATIADTAAKDTEPSLAAAAAPTAS